MAEAAIRSGMTYDEKSGDVVRLASARCELRVDDAYEPGIPRGG